MKTLTTARWMLFAGLAVLAGCGDDGAATDDGGGDDVPFDGDVSPDIAEAEADADADGDGEVEADARPPGPGPEFDDFCGTTPWSTTLVPATLHETSGTYGGVYNSFAAGTLEFTKVIPEHPFHVTGVRVAFGGGAGAARIRLMQSFGRSYPLGYPRLDEGGGDLVAPMELDVPRGSGADDWIDIDLSDDEIYLLPTRHYVIVYQHYATEPFLAIDELAAGDWGRAEILVPGESTPYGVDGNYRLQLVGSYFCSMAVADRWFREDTTQPFVDVGSQRAAVADLNGDGHDDLILNDGSPHVYFGDGAGGFAEAGFDPFPDAPYAQMLVFGDLDNDGDQDAFASTNVSPDGDGDTVQRDAGDCDNADAAIAPGLAEIAANGKDDDCDTVADDGTDTSDADADGVTIAAGDCNDTLNTVFPGAPEIPDNRDNDCDGEADEDFYHRILLNDGTGHFTAVPDPGVAVIEPTAAAAFGDGNGDGFLDVYWGNWLIHYPDPGSAQDHYATGNGDGTFLDESVASGMRPAAGRPCYGVIWNDYNNDGLQDIGVHNYGYELNFLWENQGGNRFVDVGFDVGMARDGVGARGGNTFGGDWGDIDNDGDLDLFEANISHPRYQPTSDPSLMLVNDGAPDFHFTEQRAALGIEYDEGDVNAAFADYDNDGDLDLVVTPVYPGHYSRLYRNDGGTHFTDVTYETGTAVMETASPVWSDIDEDGDLDLIIADRSGAPFLHLFVNEAAGSSHWLQLDLQGTTSNRDGVGARVALTASGGSQIREVKGGGGHGNTQQTRIVQLGLGSGTAIDSLTVRWVGGATETITGIVADHRYRVVQGSGTGVELF